MVDSRENKEMVAIEQEHQMVKVNLRKYKGGKIIKKVFLQNLGHEIFIVMMVVLELPKK
jgi:hypothetical protein